MKCNTIRQEVRFSYDIVKGSLKNRYNKTTELSKDIFQTITERIHDNKIDIADIVYAMEKNMPEQKPVKVIPKKNQDIFEGASDYIEKKGQYVGQTIEIPVVRGKLPLKSLPVYMHELTHVLDILFNPKYTARSIKMEQKHLYDKKYSHCIDNTLYKAEKYNTLQEKEDLLNKRKSEIKNWISGKKPDEKLDCIQEAKNYLEKELKAYKSEGTFHKKMKANGLEVQENQFEDEAHEYLFEEKIELLKDLGKEIVKKERKRNLQKRQNNTGIEQKRG